MHRLVDPRVERELGRTLATLHAPSPTFLEIFLRFFFVGVAAALPTRRSRAERA